MALRDNGVDDGDLLSRPGQATLAKHRVIAADQILVRFDSGSTDPVDVETEAELIGRVRDAWPDFDAVVVSDYGYGVVTSAVIDAVADLQRQKPADVDRRCPRPVPPPSGCRATAVKPNYGEACRLLGERERSEPRSRAAQMASQGPRLLELTGCPDRRGHPRHRGGVHLRTRSPAIPDIRQAAEPQPLRGCRRHVRQRARPGVGRGSRDSRGIRTRFGGRRRRRRQGRHLGMFRGRASGLAARRRQARRRRGEARRPDRLRAGPRPPDRVHQRLLRHPPSRPRHVPEPGEGARRHPRRRRELGRECPPAEG